MPRYSDSELIDRLSEFLSGPGRKPDEFNTRLSLDWKKEFAARLDDAGLAAPTWPVDAGGLELSPYQQLVYGKMLSEAKAPKPPSGIAGIVGPAIIKHGTAQQRERFLPPTIRGDILWCQGFSEPSSGSDLPSLRTRALRDGEVYRVTGQKIWTTEATRANWMFALVRTGPPGSGRRGITYLLIPIDSPGLDVRALRDLSGGTHFAEVFFNDVEVPVENRLGEENEGWAVARSTLGFERGISALAKQASVGRTVDQLLRLAEDAARLEDPDIRAKISSLIVDARIILANGAAVIRQLREGKEPGAGSSASRLIAARFEQRLNEVALDIAGESALLGQADPEAFDHGRWNYGYLMTRASTIGTGTTEIQKNTIAERVLGLPKPTLTIKGHG